MICVAKFELNHIFNINNKEDLICCIEGGLTASDIADLYNRLFTPFFYFGVNHPKPEVIKNFATIREQLTNSLDDVLPCVVAYVLYHESYQKVYEKYIAKEFACLVEEEDVLTDYDALAMLKAKIDRESC